MIEKFQHKYALSRKGAMDLIRACGTSALADLALMLPAVILYMLISDLLNNLLAGSQPRYIIGSVIVLILVAVTQHITYNACFLSTYLESGIRRTTIAEHLRKLSLSFFGKKDLSDLSSNIMADSARIETATSH